LVILANVYKKNLVQMINVVADQEIVRIRFCFPFRFNLKFLGKRFLKKSIVLRRKT